MIDPYFMAGGAVLTAAAIGWVRKLSTENADLRERLETMTARADEYLAAYWSAENEGAMRAQKEFARKGNAALRAKQAADREATRAATLEAMANMTPMEPRSVVVASVPRTAAERAQRQADDAL